MAQSTYSSDTWFPWYFSLLSSGEDSATFVAPSRGHIVGISSNLVCSAEESSGDAVFVASMSEIQSYADLFTNLSTIIAIQRLNISTLGGGAGTWLQKGNIHFHPMRLKVQRGAQIWLQLFASPGDCQGVLWYQRG